MRLVIGTALAFGMAMWMPSARAASDQGSSIDESQSGDTTQVQTPAGSVEETPNPPPEQGGYGPGTETAAPGSTIETAPGTTVETSPGTTVETAPGTTVEPAPGTEGPGQTTVTAPGTEPYMPPTQVRAERHGGPGFSITAGGGVFGFTNSTVRDATTDLGGMYTARLGIGTRRLLALEVAYIGSAQNINTLGVADDAVLLSNGAEGVLRLNGGGGMVQPYVLGGAAWRHYSVNNTSFNTSDINDSDNVVEFPVGLGVDFRPVSGLIIDARGAYRFTTSNDLLRFGGQNLNNWEATLKAGVEF